MLLKKNTLSFIVWWRVIVGVVHALIELHRLLLMVYLLLLLQEVVLLLLRV